MAQTGVMDDILPPRYHREEVLGFISYLSHTRLAMYRRNAALCFSFADKHRKCLKKDDPQFQELGYRSAKLFKSIELIALLGKSLYKFT